MHPFMRAWVSPHHCVISVEAHRAQGIVKNDVRAALPDKRCGDTISKYPKQSFVHYTVSADQYRTVSGAQQC